MPGHIFYVCHVADAETVCQHLARKLFAVLIGGIGLGQLGQQKLAPAGGIRARDQLFDSPLRQLIIAQRRIFPAHADKRRGDYEHDGGIYYHALEKDVTFRTAAARMLPHDLLHIGIVHFLLSRILCSARPAHGIWRTAPFLRGRSGVSR